MVMHSRQAFRIIPGAPYEREVAVVDERNEPVDLTGYNVYLRIARSERSVTTSVDIVSDMLSVDAAEGLISVRLPGELTRSWSGLPNCTYTLDIEHPKLLKERVLEGAFVVSPVFRDDISG